MGWYTSKSYIHRRNTIIWACKSLFRKSLEALEERGLFLLVAGGHDRIDRKTRSQAVKARLAAAQQAQSRKVAK